MLISEWSRMYSSIEHVLYTRMTVESGFLPRLFSLSISALHRSRVFRSILCRLPFRRSTFPDTFSHFCFYTQSSNLEHKGRKSFRFLTPFISIERPNYFFRPCSLHYSLRFLRVFFHSINFE